MNASDGNRNANEGALANERAWSNPRRSRPDVFTADKFDQHGILIRPGHLVGSKDAPEGDDLKFPHKRGGVVVETGSPRAVTIVRQVPVSVVDTWAASNVEVAAGFVQWWTYPYEQRYGRITDMGWAKSDPWITIRGGQVAGEDAEKKKPIHADWEITIRPVLERMAQLVSLFQIMAQVPFRIVKRDREVRGRLVSIRYGSDAECQYPDMEEIWTAWKVQELIREESVQAELAEKRETARTRRASAFWGMTSAPTVTSGFLSDADAEALFG